MGMQTGAGTALAISAAAPASQDAAGYGALAFTEIGGIDKIGALGASYGKVEFQPLKGAKLKFKGPADYGSIQPSLAIDSADAGQTLLRTAAKDEVNTLFSFKETFPNGDKRFFQGRCFGMPENVDGAGSMIMATPVIEACTKIVEVAGP